MKKPTIKERLEYLRQEIIAERISYGEIIELQSLIKHIDMGDVLLLEWAGVKE
jgi:transcription elongation factor